MVVVVSDVGSGIILIAAFVNSAILVDDPVIAAAGPVPGFVAAVDVFDGPLLIDTGG